MNDFEFHLNDMLQDGHIHVVDRDVLLKAHRVEIAQVVKEERERFIKTLNGMRIVVWKKGDEMADAFVEKINNSIDMAIAALKGIKR